MENSYVNEISEKSSWPYDDPIETEDATLIKKQIRRGSNINSLLMFLFYAIILVISIILGISGIPDMIESTSLRTLISYTISHPITISILVFLTIIITKKGLSGIFRKPERSALWIIKWIVIGAGLSYLANYIIVFIGAIISIIFKSELNTVDFISEGNIYSSIVYFIALSIYAPVFEELLFRGVMLPRTSKFGVIFSSITIGLSFGLWHLNIQQFAYATVMGFFATFMALKTKSIIPPMLLHFFLNFIGTLQSIIIPNVNLEAMQEGVVFSDFTELGYFAILSIIGLFCILLAITAFVLVIIEITRNYKKIISGDACPQLSLKRKLFTYFTAPVTIIVFVAALVYSTLFTLNLL